jgi:hypothetical protein
MMLRRLFGRAMLIVARIGPAEARFVAAFIVLGEPGPRLREDDPDRTVFLIAAVLRDSEALGGVTTIPFRGTHCVHLRYVKIYNANDGTGRSFRDSA